MTISSSRWETSSAGEAPDTRPSDLITLGEHKAHCCAVSGRWVAVRMAAGRFVQFLSVRLVTTVAVLFALVAALLIWL